MKVVAKFGGSSVKDAASMERCAQIVADSRPSLVILSATYNTTNELEQLFERKDPGLIGPIINRHYSLAETLGIIDKLASTLDGLGEELQFLIKQESSAELKDAIVSCGERLSTALFHEVLKKTLKSHCTVHHVDSRDYLLTDEEFGRANPLRDEIDRRVGGLAKLLGSRDIVLAQGYIGRSTKGKTTTLGREGSDFSAALFASALGADECIIYTDVPGIAQCDPHQFSEAGRIGALTYDEVELLCRFGAKVLFPETVGPLKEKFIPLRVKSSIEIDKEGTLITTQTDLPGRPVAFSYLKGKVALIGTAAEQWADKVKEQLSLSTYEYQKAGIVFDFDQDKMSEVLKLIQSWEIE